jgi:hypothetical protein
MKNATIALPIGMLAALVLFGCVRPDRVIIPEPASDAKRAATPTPTPKPRMSYYFGIQWRDAAHGGAPIGPQIWIGPYTSLAWCRDTLGSELYSHPLACHVTGPNPPANCRILGNGAAYPRDYPADAYKTANGPLQIPTSDCTAFPAKQPFGLRWGPYFLYYDATGGASVHPASQFKIYLAKRKKDPNARMGLVHAGCPGAPFFDVGFDDACN